MIILNSQIEAAVPATNTGTAADRPDRSLTQQLFKDVRDAAYEFVPDTFTPTLAAIPRTVPQYNWPVDNYSVVLRYTPAAGDVNGDYVLDMMSNDLTGLQVRYISATSIRISYAVLGASARTADIDLTAAITDGHEVALLMWRNGNTAGYVYTINDGAQVTGSYAGAADFVDMEWPSIIGLAGEHDGTDQTVNPLVDFRVARGVFDFDTVATDIDAKLPPIIVFDGRTIYSDQSNTARMALADQDTHAIKRGDVAVFQQGILHSVIPAGYPNSGITVQSGTNANGDWMIGYGLNDNVLWRWFRVVANSITGGNTTVTTPITMGGTSYTVVGNNPIDGAVGILVSAQSIFNTTTTFGFSTYRTDNATRLGRTGVILYGFEFAVTA